MNMCLNCSKNMFSFRHFALRKGVFKFSSVRSLTSLIYNSHRNIVMRRLLRIMYLYAIFTSSSGDQSRGLDVKARLVKQIVVPIQKIIAFREVLVF